MPKQYKPINSKSYIIVICSEDSDPKINRLLLRDDSASSIGLNPGKNILTIKDNPNLKYGFSTYKSSSHKVFPDNPWILQIDLSHFKSSEMVTMEDMFHNMINLEYIDMTGIQTTKVTNMKALFSNTPSLLFIRGLDNLSTDRVECMDYMFSMCGLRKLNLSNFYTAKVKSCVGMFFNSKVESINLPEEWMQRMVIQSGVMEAHIASDFHIMNNHYFNDYNVKFYRVNSEKALQGVVADFYLPNNCFQPLGWIMRVSENTSFQEIYKKVHLNCKFWDYIKTKPLSYNDINYFLNIISESRFLIDLPTPDKPFINPYPEETLRYKIFQGSIVQVFWGLQHIEDLQYAVTPMLPLCSLLLQMEQIMHNVFGTIVQKSENSENLSPNHHIDFWEIIPKVQTFLVTTEMVGKKHTTINPFTGKKQDDTPIPDSPKDSGDWLGCYVPETGSIYMWVDRIYEYRNYALIFQKVLLHEFIHFLFDLIRRFANLKSDKTINNKSEETWDNFLVLHTYANAISPLKNGAEYSLKMVRNFIDQQSPVYKAGGTKFDQYKQWIQARNEITNFLTLNI